MAPNVIESPAADVNSNNRKNKNVAESKMTALAATNMKSKAKLYDVSNKVPIISKDKPPFTVAELKTAIPAHCFKATYIESFAHLAFDLVQIVAAVTLVLYLDQFVSDNVLLRAPLWIAYWFFQGATGMGVWVIAHECGHGGFSPNQIVNDTVGFILHSALFVPYFSWQRTHSNHHHFTNHISKDEAHVPPKHAGKTPVGNAKQLIVFSRLVGMLLIGWPMYLMFNSSAHQRNEGEDLYNSHFKPTSYMFRPKDQNFVLLSGLGLVAAAASLVYTGHVFGYLLVFVLYLPSLLVVNGFLVAITFLQHIDRALPHYDETEWNWLRGALCTVDRTMGRFFDYKLHFIHSTHVCHHIFSYLPFYHAEEATEALKKKLGQYYAKDGSNFAIALYKNFRDCHYLENGEGVLYWIEEHLDH